MEQIPWPPSSSSSDALLNAVQSFFENTNGNPNDPSSNQDDLQSVIHQQSTSLHPTLVSIRRLLHRYPELMFQERLTSQIVQRVLKEMGIEEFSVGWGKNIYSKYYDRNEGGDVELTNDTTTEEYDGGGFGIVVDIGSGESPCVLLRADMDALPIVERTPLPPDLAEEQQRQQRAHQFHSHHHGKMHACGHDAHMTMLLGATHILHSLQQNNKYLFPGTIRIIFQPAEEGGAGAKRMSEEGVLVQHPKPSYAFAMHVWPTLPSGTIGFRSGPMLGAADMFTLTIEGVGGHAAFPHLVSDPIVASSAIILNLQTLVSRGMNPLESGVVSVTQVEAGDGAFNVIPAKAVMRGTIRALSDQSLLELREGLVSIATHTALAHGCKLSLSSFSKDHYPVTMNNDMLFPFASKVAGLVSEGGEVTNVDPTMGAEDFAFLAQGVPSAFFFLGQGGNNEEDIAKEDEGCTVDSCKSGGRVPTNLGLHHPEFNLDESVLGRGVELFVNLALRALKDLNEGSTL